MILGVIGGAGVAATNTFCHLLEERFTRAGAFRDAHHPEVLIHQATKCPSRSMYLEGRGEDFVPGYVKSGRGLKASGADLLIMVCNTAHYAKDEIAAQVGLPFFDVLAATVSAAKVTGRKAIGLLASDGIIRTGLYQRYLDTLYPEAHLILPSPDVQKDVTRAIVNTKSTKRFLEEDHAERPKVIFDSVCDHLNTRGADVIISGCTDLRVDCQREMYKGMPIVDSLSASVEGIFQLLHKPEEK